MQPFTLDQSIIAGLLFLLGLLIGMFFLAGGKWKKRYAAEAARAAELERENARMDAEVRERDSLRHAAVKAPAAVHHEEPQAAATAATTEPYQRAEPGGGSKPDIVIRRR